MYVWTKRDNGTGHVAFSDAWSGLGAVSAFGENHVRWTAARILNMRREGESDVKIQRMLVDTAGRDPMVCPPGGCTPQIVAAAFEYASSADTKQRPIDDGMARAVIERVKALVEYYRKQGKSDGLIVGQLRVELPKSLLPGVQAPFIETHIVEAFRQLDLGFGLGQLPPSTYNIEGKTDRSLAAVGPPIPVPPPVVTTAAGKRKKIIFATVIGVGVLAASSLVFFLVRRSGTELSGGQSKSMRDFIRENRDEIDAAIKRACLNCPLNNEERREWIMNDEGLYNWARGEGVRI